VAGIRTRKGVDRLLDDEREGRIDVGELPP